LAGKVKEGNMAAENPVTTRTEKINISFTFGVHVFPAVKYFTTVNISVKET